MHNCVQYLGAWMCLFLATSTLAATTTTSPGKKAVPRRDAEYPPPEFVATVMAFHDICVKETGVTEESIKEFSDGDVHEDPALKCYMACSFEKGGVVHENGEIHLEKFYEILPEIMKKESLRTGLKCLKNPAVGRCERAFWLHKCWKTTNPVLYFLL